MSTESTIVMRTRVAVKQKNSIEIELPDYIANIQFKFMDGTICQSIEEWYDCCIKRDMVDIKLGEQTDDIKRDPFGAAYEEDMIVCIWKDGGATAFYKTISFLKNGKASPVFVENIYTGEIKNLYNVPDITEDFKQNLSDLIELSEKLNEPYFKKNFEIAYNLLNESVIPNHEDISHYMSDLPERMKTIMMARAYSYVFGGMGSWNDCPPGEAEEIGLKEEYDRLTNALILNQRRALFYVTNEC